MTERHASVGVGATVAGRFHLTSELGEGGMGRVYGAVDLNYDRPAAVKVIARRLAQDEEFRQRFEREANAAQRANHPHVLPVWDHGEHEGRLYLATPLCDTDLGSLIADRGELDPPRALAIVAQVAWALDWAHARGVIHRDVKPENVLLVAGPREDHAYLADFGLAKAAVHDALTQAGHPAGMTPFYAAPEQWLGEAVGRAADQYALAGTLYTCLAGYPPFHPHRGPSLREAHLQEPPPNLARVMDGVPEGVARAIQRGLAKRPIERFGTCGELIAAADAGLRTTPPRVRRPADISVERAARSTLLPSEVPDPEPKTTAPPAAPGGATPHAETLGEPLLVPVRPLPGETPGPTAETPTDARPRGPRVVARRVAMTTLLALVAAGVAIALIERAPDQPGRKPVGITPVRVGNGPVDVAAGTGGVWVANLADNTVTRIAPRTARVRAPRIPTVRSPVGIAVDGSRVWVVGVGGELGQIEARTGRAIGPKTNLEVNASGIAAGLGAAWITAGTAGQVIRVDAVSRAQLNIAVDNAPAGVAVGYGSVWVVHDESATLVRLDRAGRRVATVQLRGAGESVAVGEGGVWVTSPRVGRLSRVHPRTNQVVEEIAVAPSQSGGDVAVGDGAVFYVDFDGGRAIRIDPSTNRPVGRPVALGAAASAVAIADGAVWVSKATAASVVKLAF